MLKIDEKTEALRMDWAAGFLKRHKDRINNRMCQNISKKRAGVSVDTVNSYFEELEKTIEGVPPENIVNYDETNLTHDPGRRRMIFKRGIKYPERIINGTKSSTSLMLAGSASCEILPVYVVFKSEHLWSTWTEGGPKNARYNRSKSGWFDLVCFNDWFNTVALPYCKRLPGKKVLIGDNLSSHFNNQILQACEINNIAFVCLPPNATHLCQPLDVAYFGPMKNRWRTILTAWKTSGRKNAGTVPKDQFPKLLRKLMEELPNQKENLISGFRKCGIYPIDPQPVLNRLPKTENTEEINSSVSEVFIHRLKHLRHGNDDEPTRKVRRKRIDVVPGRSVGELSEREPSTSNPTPPPLEEDEPPRAEQEFLSDTDSSDSEIQNHVDNDRNVFEQFQL